MDIKRNSKILIAGGSGMVGSAIIRNLLKNGYNNIHATYHKHTLSEMDIKLFWPDLKVDNETDTMPKEINWYKIDILKQDFVERMFDEIKPEVVVIAAAKVGGILANNTHRADFIYNNLAIETNLIHQAHISKVKKLIFLGSSCIYPKDCPQPMKEEYLLSGTLEPTNEPYAIAKIAGIKMCESYFRQHDDNFFSLMPTNLYGPGDNYDLETSHVIPALLKKFHEAKLNKNEKVIVWGTGKPKREFLYVDDLADSVEMAIKSIKAKDIYNLGISHLNVGSGKDISIKELSVIIKDIVNYNGQISFDKSRPDGMLKKVLNVSKIKSFGFESKTSFPNGVRRTLEYYKSMGLKCD